MGCFHCLLKFVSALTVCSMISKTTALMKPPNMSAEMYCIGCELTVKELDSMLSRPLTRGIEETVTIALNDVCKLDSFKKNEVRAKTSLEVCKYIKDDEGLKGMLIATYDQKHKQQLKTTYLDITQKICGRVLGACPTAEQFETNSEDGGVVFDAETQEFKIDPGKKVRMATPIKDMKQENMKMHQEDMKMHKQEMDRNADRNVGMERMEQLKALRDLPENERIEKMKEIKAEIDLERFERMHMFEDHPEIERLEIMKELKDLSEDDRRNRIREMQQEAARQPRKRGMPKRNLREEL